MIRSLLPLALSSLLVALSGCAHTPRGGETMVLREGSEGIQVVGEGKAEARPDRARFEIGIEARRPTVAEAREASASAQTRVLDAIRAAGIASEDIQTTQLSIQPEYEYTEGGRNLLGYTARNTVQVRVREIDSVSDVVDAGVRAGGDDVRLQGIGFELSDPESLRATAREEAMTEARATAEQLARLAGVELGEPIAIEEVVSGGGPVPMMQMRMADSAETSTPVEAGTTEVQVQLRVRWSIR
ncbi:MAG: SIMPL domain-containing protein [Myxococcota bacterium]|nr:SIMPL domain-containing protein [Myxococcota bacterium]